MLAFPRSAVEGTIAQRWRSVVAAGAERPAVLTGSTHLTYGQLDERARALARALADGPATEPVAVLVQRDDAVAVAVAATGVLLSGRPLLALDAASPAPRLAAVVDAGGARTCVVDGPGAQPAAALGLDPLDVHQPPAAPAWSPPQPAPTAAASVVFTSGTTGRPQGVTCSARVTLHDAWLRAEAGWCRPDDTVALLLPPAFGLGLAELVSGLLTGAALSVHDPRTAPERLLRALTAAGATVLAATPSLLRSLTCAEGAADLLPPRLRLVRSGGERFAGADAEAVAALLPPGCVLLNVLGSSETGLLTSFAVAPGSLGDAPAVPAGWPVADRELHVERADGSPAAPGETGELVATSAYLPTGYWGEPARTAERFEHLPDGRVRVRTRDRARMRADGCLELLGRMDLTIKVRGHRVEPAEVEAALLGHESVAEAVVVGHERPDAAGRRSRTRLVAYVAPRRGAAVRPAALRAHVRDRLPAAMVPDLVVAVPALPRTERGKVDRAALPPPPAGGSAAYAEPRTDWERVLAELWGFVLEVHEVGRDDDFFELGGDSLDVEHLLTRLASEHGVAADAAAVAAAPTVAAFASRHPRGQRRAAGGAARRASTGAAALVPATAGPPLFCVAGAGGLGVAFLPLARHLAATCPVHALQAHRLETGGLPDWSVRRAARRHLRAVRAVQPVGPYHLVGHSLGGLIALEMAHRLREVGEQVALLVVLDTYPPGHEPPPPPSPRTAGPAALRRLRTAAGVALTGLVPVPGQGHYPRFFRQGTLLSRWYRPRPWDGDTLVLVAADNALGDRAQGWEEHLTGRWEVREVPGDHTSVLREPAAAVLAQELSRALQSTWPDRTRIGAQRRPETEEASHVG